MESEMPSDPQPQTPEHVPPHQPQHSGRGQSVSWTPEDATNLIVTSIREMQSPMMHSLKRHGVPRTAFFSTLLILTLVIVGLGGILYKQDKYYRDIVSGKEAALSAAQEKAEAKQAELDKLREGLAKKAFSTLDTISVNQNTVENLKVAEKDVAAAQEQYTKLRKDYSALLKELNSKEASLSKRETIASALQQRLTAAKQEAESATEMSKERQDRILGLTSQLSDLRLVVKDQKRAISKLRDRFKGLSDILEEVDEDASEAAASADENLEPTPVVDMTEETDPEEAPETTDPEDAPDDAAPAEEPAATAVEKPEGTTAEEAADSAEKTEKKAVDESDTDTPAAESAPAKESSPTATPTEGASE